MWPLKKSKSILSLPQVITDDFFFIFFGFANSDYIQVDDDFWDMEFGESPRKRGRRQPGSPRERRPRASASERKAAERERIIARYRIMKYQVQDRNGAMVMMKKRVT